MKHFVIAPLLFAAAVLPASMTAAAQDHSGFENPRAQNQPSPAAEAAMKFPVPDALDAEHAELHAELQQIIQSGGKTGQAAQAVADVLHPHFLKEEEYALPPLALLRELASGTVSPGMAAILPLTDELKRSLPQMLIEHQHILAALEHLATVAKAEDKPQAERFASQLMHHAQMEEQVTYPAAILVGEYLKLRLEAKDPRAGG